MCKRPSRGIRVNNVTCIAAHGITIGSEISGGVYASRAVQFHPMAVNPVSPGSPHVLRAHMGVHRTCGEPNEIKKNTDPEKYTPGKRYRS